MEIPMRHTYSLCITLFYSFFFLSQCYNKSFHLSENIFYVQIYKFVDDCKNKCRCQQLHFIDRNNYHGQYTCILALLFGTLTVVAARVSKDPNELDKKQVKKKKKAKHYKSYKFFLPPVSFINTEDILEYQIQPSNQLEITRKICMQIHTSTCGNQVADLYYGNMFS